MDIIKQFMDRYEKEFDYYEIASRIAAQLIEEKLQVSGIRAIVTYRAKREKRLKLKIENRNSEKNYKVIEDIYKDIVDLAGVRVALYFPGERFEVEKIIRGLFNFKGEPKEFNGTTDPNYKKRFSGYWATHYRVQIPEILLNESQKRYSNAKVEIQVASVLMHAWSEVEHDLVYKPTEGNLSDQELAILDELNGLVLTGEIALERLQGAIDSRIEKQGAYFRNHYELASFLFEATKSLIKKEVDAEPIIGDVEILYLLLKKLNIATPLEIKPFIESLHPETDSRSISQQIIDQIIQTDPKRYEAYSDIRKVTNKYSKTKEHAIGEFLSKWIVFERFLNIIVLMKGSQLHGSIVLMSVIKNHDIFSKDEANEILYLRRVRNNLIHGIEIPETSYIEEATKRIESIIENLKHSSDSDIKKAINEAIGTTE